MKSSVIDVCCGCCCRVLVVAVLTCLIGAQIRGEKAALLIIDVQDCFLPGGSLAVKDGHQVRSHIIITIVIVVIIKHKFKGRIGVCVDKISPIDRRFERSMCQRSDHLKMRFSVLPFPVILYARCSWR